MFRRVVTLKQVITWILRLAKTRLSRYLHLFLALLRRLVSFAPPGPRGDNNLDRPDHFKNSDDDCFVVHASCQPSTSRAIEKQRTMPTSDESSERPVSAPNGIERLSSVACGEQKNCAECYDELEASSEAHSDGTTVCLLQYRNKYVI